MHSTRRLRYPNDKIILRVLAVVSTSSLPALVVWDNPTSFATYSASSPIRRYGPCSWLIHTACDDHPTSKSQTVIPGNNNVRFGGMRRMLAWLRLTSLPLPRVLVKGDPAFAMNATLLRKRQEDDIKMKELVLDAISNQERDPKVLQDLNDKCLELAYGDGVTMKIRQDFVHVSCTATVFHYYYTARLIF